MRFEGWKMRNSRWGIRRRADRGDGQHRMLTKKLTKRCQAMPIPDHAAVMNEKAHQAKALMGFGDSASDAGARV